MLVGDMLPLGEIIYNNKLWSSVTVCDCLVIMEALIIAILSLASFLTQSFKGKIIH